MSEAEREMNKVPYTAVRILKNLPVSERLVDCNMCMEDRVRLVQLGVIGHQVALCGPCLRRIMKALEAWPRLFP